MICCHPECEKEAEFDVIDSTKNCGCDPYTRSTSACRQHVGDLMTHTNLVTGQELVEEFTVVTIGAAMPMASPV